MGPRSDKEADTKGTNIHQLQQFNGWINNCNVSIWPTNYEQYNKKRFNWQREETQEMDRLVYPFCTEL